jgi:FMN-binding domain
MRRVFLAITGTIAGLIALLSFKSHSGIAPSPGLSGTSGTSSAVSTPGTYISGPVKPGARERAIRGKAVGTKFGPVQIELVVHNKRIVKVAVLQQPHKKANDLAIGHAAFPRLISETIAAQSARIDAVAGATYTSNGYIKSLQSAVDKGL